MWTHTHIHTRKHSSTSNTNTQSHTLTLSLSHALLHNVWCDAWEIWSFWLWRWFDMSHIKPIPGDTFLSAVMIFFVSALQSSTMFPQYFLTIWPQFYIHYVTQVFTCKIGDFKIVMFIYKKKLVSIPSSDIIFQLCIHWWLCCK